MSRPPLGYVIENKRLAVGDPRDVATVKRMFADYLGGHSLRAIALQLNADGIKTQRGKRWNVECRQGVCWTIPRYIGRFRWNVNPREKYHCVRDGEILPVGSLAAVTAIRSSSKTTTLPSSTVRRSTPSSVVWRNDEPRPHHTRTVAASCSRESSSVASVAVRCVGTLRTQPFGIGVTSTP